MAQHCDNLQRPPGTPGAAHDSARALSQRAEESADDDGSILEIDNGFEAGRSARLHSSTSNASRTSISTLATASTASTRSRTSTSTHRYSSGRAPVVHTGSIFLATGTTELSGAPQSPYPSWAESPQVASVIRQGACTRREAGIVGNRHPGRHLVLRWRTSDSNLARSDDYVDENGVVRSTTSAVVQIYEQGATLALGRPLATYRVGRSGVTARIKTSHHALKHPDRYKCELVDHSDESNGRVVEHLEFDSALTRAAWIGAINGVTEMDASEDIALWEGSCSGSRESRAKTTSAGMVPDGENDDGFVTENPLNAAIAVRARLQEKEKQRKRSHTAPAAVMFHSSAPLSPLSTSDAAIAPPDSDVHPPPTLSPDTTSDAAIAPADSDAHPPPTLSPDTVKPDVPPPCTPPSRPTNAQAEAPSNSTTPTTAVEADEPCAVSTQEECDEKESEQEEQQEAEQEEQEEHDEQQQQGNVEATPTTERQSLTGPNIVDFLFEADVGFDWRALRLVRNKS